ncbi:MAG: protein kinase, partial [Acidobacteriota bacterium]|nr:protein kinase [Acidobacteriota bacterium]
MIGQTLGHYRVLEQIGAGGMGLVFRAHDERLDRDVALKVLTPGTLTDDNARKRFRKEALTLSQINHPNIETVHDFDTQEGVDFLVMELIPGITLDEKLAAHPLKEKEILALGIQLAQGLEAAHEQGVVHRDLKPGNLRVTGDGRLKILDFGLAKLLRPVSDTANTESLSQTKGVAGTLPYMAPEQLRGQPADARSDIWAAGAVLYEMTTGHRPFPESGPMLVDGILNRALLPPSSARPGVSSGLDGIVTKALDKDPNRRYQSARELLVDLERLSPGAQATILVSQFVRRQQVMAPLSLLLLAGALGGAWWYHHSSPKRWANEQAIPQIAQLMDKSQFFAAFRLARKAERYAPGDPTLARLRLNFSVPATVETEPAGADVYVKEYSDVKGDWEYLGKSPIRLNLPLANYRWKVEKSGFETIESAAEGEKGFSFTLQPSGSSQPNMLLVPGGSTERGKSPVEVPGFLIGKYEVTNREFKAFVDAGGYKNRDYWTEKFLEDSSELSWQEAMSRFRDATGRPGPATWELGEYPRGQEDYPVSGVSWYEAAAYAKFVSKRLPSIYEWRKAAGASLSSEILDLSNFGSKGPAPVGSHSGLGPFGTYDM